MDTTARSAAPSIVRRHLVMRTVLTLARCFKIKPLRLLWPHHWMYSYQCSSELVVDYVPVLVLTYTISGAIMPLLWMIVPQETIVWMRKKWNNAPIETFLDLCALSLPHEMLSDAKYQQKPVTIIDGFTIRLKLLLSVTVLLTFGIASPLLGIIVCLDLVVLCIQMHFAVGRFEDMVSESKENKSSLLQRLCLSQLPPLSYEFVIVFSFVGIFWSLFVFDMLGDVYGSFSGGMSMLVPLILPLPFWLIQFDVVEKSRALTSTVSEAFGIQLTTVHNPAVVQHPQVPGDGFQEGSL